MNIDGGGLHFESSFDNDKMHAAIEETIRRVRGLTDATVSGGKAMDEAFQQTADDINKAFQDIDKMTDIHTAALRDLEAEYNRLGEAAGNAFMQGKDDEYRALTEKQQAIKGEISTRKQLLKEIEEQSNALVDAERKMEAERKKVEENANAQVSMRTRIKELREEMMLLIDQGIDEQSEAYKRLVEELGRLTDIQMDVQQQARNLANDEAMFQGVIEGLSGLSGGFSAVTGTVSLFAGENENLQKIMVKVQSLMAITIGLQQVAQTLNKDSAFQLVTLNGLKEWWNGLVAKATIVETAETAATVANTTAQGANTASLGANSAATATNTVATGAQAASATAGTVANIGLAGAFRMVGLAIKSIPVFGWILAGISALIGLYSYFSSKAREAAKAQEEFTKAMIESVYKPIASIENLSLKWNQLGDDLDAKKKFVEANKKAFDELGVAVRDVADAERILNSGKEAFIAAQIAKAKAMIYVQQSTEKIKKQMELEAEIAKMSDTRTYYVGGGQFGGGTYYEGENTAKTKKKKQLEELKAEIRLGYENAALEESEALKKMTELGVESTNTYKDGTVGAIEQAIQLKQEALKLLTTNDEYKKGVAEIADLQKQLEGITGKKITGGGGGSSSKDPFLDKLEKQKKEYQRFMKWLNSGDETLVKAANKEFEGLLKQGATYIDYLKRQREIIESIDVSKRTKAQNTQLRTLNDQIAEETKKTVLESFNTELSEQLSNAKTIMQMLDIIEQRRKKLANDGTELDNSKKETLDEAEKDVVKQAKEETNALLENYTSYLQQKIRLEQQFTNDMKLLEKHRKEATTDAEREEIDRVIENRRLQHDKDSKSSGDADYDSLKDNYKTYQQRLTDIQAEYAEKRRIATLHNDKLLLAQLADAENKELSKLANEQLTSSVDWQKMFGNLSDLSTSTINKLIKNIESQKIQFSADFNPQDLQAINEQLRKAHDEVNNRNPFKALSSAFKELKQQLSDQKLLDSNDPFLQELTTKQAEYNKYQGYIKSGNETLVKGADQAFTELLKDGTTYLEFLKRKKQELQGKIDMGIEVGNSMDILNAVITQQESGVSASDALRQSLKDTFSSVSGSLDLVKGSFDAVVGGMEKMGVQMDEETQAILNDIGGILSGASNLATGIASGNPLQIIQGSIDIISNGYDLIFGNKDRKVEKAIRKHAEAIGELEKAYTALSWAIDKALGGEVYKNQKAAITNMKEQRQHLLEMQRNERDKKKTDNGKIQEWQAQYEELGRQIEDMLDSISNDILQTDAKTFANELGDALVNAFAKGESAADAFGETVDNVIKQAVLNQLKKNFLEKQLQGALDNLEKSMGYWNGDNFVFDGLSDAEIAAFKNQVSGITNGFNQAMNAYSELFKDIAEPEDPDTSLTGSVKGVTEETASLVAGQMNAIRINQMESTSILRQQLIHMAIIAQNTSYNKFIESIYNHLRQNGTSGDPLRSQGLS